MRIGICLLLFLSMSAAHAVTPVAPQFVALSVPDAQKSAAWYRQAFGLRVLDEIRPDNGEAHIILLASDTLLMEILQLRDARSPGAEATFKVRCQAPVGNSISLHLINSSAANNTSSATANGILI